MQHAHCLFEFIRWILSWFYKDKVQYKIISMLRMKASRWKVIYSNAWLPNIVNSFEISRFCWRRIVLYAVVTALPTLATLTYCMLYFSCNIPKWSLNARYACKLDERGTLFIVMIVFRLYAVFKICKISVAYFWHFKKHIWLSVYYPDKQKALK